MKIIFSDMDGTLLNSSHQLSSYTKEVLTEVNRLGNKIVLASGRAYDAMKLILDTLPFIPLTATLNGGYILDENHNLIFSSPIAKNILLALESNISLMGLEYFYFTGEHWGSGTDNAYSRMEQLITKCEGTIRPLHEVCQEKDIEKVIAVGEAEALDEALENLSAMFPTLALCKSSPKYLEINNANVNKGLAVDKVTAYFNLTADDAIAFGDYDNDIPMLEKAGISIAMSNGTDNAKRAAKRIGLSNDEDGVARYLANYFGL